MERQKNEPNIKVLTIFMGIIVFFYINYSVLFFLKEIKLQILVFTISAYFLTYGVYRYLPIYIYELKDYQIVFTRQFSERYFDDYLIKIKDIKELKVKEGKNFKFWNKFYNNNKKNKIYSIKTDDIILEFEPNSKFIEVLNEKLKNAGVSYEK